MRKFTVCLLGALLISSVCLAAPKRVSNSRRLVKNTKIEKIKKDLDLKLTDAEIDNLSGEQEIKEYLKKLVRVIDELSK